MQANEFEKGVKQKMDELRFNPSAPVWTNIEKQIRRKKDRRRAIFWLPLLALLLAGGIWWVNLPESSTISMSQNKDQTVIKNGPVLSKKQEPDEKNPEIKKLPEQIPATTTIIVEKKSSISNKTAVKQPFAKKDPAVSATKFSHKKKKNPLNLSLVQNPETKSKKLKEAAAHSEKLINSTTPQTEIVNILTNENNSNDTTAIITGQANIATDSLQTKDSIFNKEHFLKDSVSISDSIQKTKEKKQKADPKWVLGLTVMGGASQAVEGADLFNGQKSADAFASPNPVSNPNTAGSRTHSISMPKNGLSFSIGFMAKKKMSNRTSFLTGLQYNYYSTQLHVGSKQKMNVVSSGNYITMARIDEFYSDSSTVNQYKNGYHFISIPLGLDIQLFKNLPLHLQTNISVQQLVSTNGLVNKNDIYYHDKKAFNKTKIFSDAGLFLKFRLNKKTNMLAGPQIQYSWSKLQKDDSPYKHLFTGGFKATIELPR